MAESQRISLPSSVGEFSSFWESLEAFENSGANQGPKPHSTKYLPAENQPVLHKSVQRPHAPFVHLFGDRQCSSRDDILWRQSILENLEIDVQNDSSILSASHRRAFSAFLGMITAAEDNGVAFHRAYRSLADRAFLVISQSFPTDPQTPGLASINEAEAIADHTKLLSRFKIPGLLAEAERARSSGNEKVFEEALLNLAETLREFGYYGTAEIVYEQLIGEGSSRAQAAMNDMKGNGLCDLADSTKDILTREGLIGVASMLAGGGVGFGISFLGRYGLIQAAKKMALDTTARQFMHQFLTSKATHAAMGAYSVAGGINATMAGLHDYRFGGTGYDSLGSFAKDTVRLGSELLVAGPAGGAANRFALTLGGGKFAAAALAFGAETAAFTGVSGVFSLTETFRRKGEEPLDLPHLDDAWTSNAIFIAELRAAKGLANTATGGRYHTLERATEKLLEEERRLQSLALGETGVMVPDTVISRQADRFSVNQLVHLIIRLPTSSRRLFVEKITQRMENADWHVKGLVIRALAEAIPLLPETERYPFVEKMAQNVTEPGVRHVAIWALRETIPFLKIGDRFRLIFWIQDRLPMNNPALFPGIFDAATAVFEGIPLKAHRDFYAKYKSRLNHAEDRLYFYLYHGGPDIFSVWQVFNAAPDPAMYLTSLKQQAQPYRYGKDVENRLSPQELCLAYIALDRPSGRQDNFDDPPMSFDLFAQRIEALGGRQIPPAFLNRSFSFELNRKTPVHESVDKGALEALIRPLDEAADGATGKDWFLNLLVSPPQSVKKSLREYLVKKFGFAPNVDLTAPKAKEKLHSAIKLDEGFFRLLNETAPYFASKTGHGDAQLETAYGRIVLTLALRRQGTEKLHTLLNQYQAAQAAKKAPSELVVETLDQLFFFYIGPVGDVLKEIQTDQIPKSVAKARSRLEVQKTNLAMAEGEVAQFDLVPSKTAADQFYGYIGEDCTKNRGNEIFNPDFLVYRMIVDGELNGMVYVYRGRSQGKKALTLSIGARARLNVSADELLRKIEEGFSGIATEEGYDYVLISTDAHQQGNRVDLMRAIAGRVYPKIDFSNEGSVLFLAKEYYVVYER